MGPWAHVVPWAHIISQARCPRPILINMYIYIYYLCILYSIYIYIYRERDIYIRAVAGILSQLFRAPSHPSPRSFGTEMKSMVPCTRNSTFSYMFLKLTTTQNNQINALTDMFCATAPPCRFDLFQQVAFQLEAVSTASTF